jgi:hypothetical protein
MLWRPSSSGDFCLIERLARRQPQASVRSKPQFKNANHEGVHVAIDRAASIR